MTVPDHFGLFRTDTVTISRKAAETISKAFLPVNPNKLRARSKDTLAEMREACFELRTALENAGRK